MNIANCLIFSLGATKMNAGAIKMLSVQPNRISVHPNRISVPLGFAACYQRDARTKPHFGATKKSLTRVSRAREHPEQ